MVYLGNTKSGRKITRRYIRNRKKQRSLAKQVRALQRQCKPETKWKEAFDITNQNTFCEYNNSLGAFDEPILNVETGVDQHDRVGNQVKIKSFYSRLLLNTPPNAPARIFRFVLYNARDVTDSLTSGGPAGNQLGLLDQIDADRFSVLFDKSYSIAPTAANTFNVKQIVLGRKFKRMIKQYYNTAALNSHSKNNIRLYIVSTQGVGSADKSYIQGYMKTYFIDP